MNDTFDRNFAQMQKGHNDLVLFNHDILPHVSSFKMGS